MPHKKMLPVLALLAVALLLLSGCAGGSSGSANDPIVGKWTLRGMAPKSENPAAATYAPSRSTTATQEFRADGTYINPRGETRTWHRVDANTVEMAKVRVVATIKANDLYETLGNSTQYWVRTQ